MIGLLLLFSSLVQASTEVKLDDASLISKLPQISAQVKEPHEGRDLKVTGVRFSAIVDYLKKEKLLSNETHAFIAARDGFVGLLELKDLLKGGALIALKVENLKDGEMLQDKFINKEFDWRPGYVVWEKPTKVNKHVLNKSPYQVTKISFGRMGDENLKPANLALTKYCLCCHQAGNWGGTKGASLESLLTRFQPDHFKKVMEMKRAELDQKSIPMPEFRGGPEEKKAILASLARLSRQ